MKIGIDFDDTIASTSEKVLEYLNKYGVKQFQNFEDKKKFYNKYIDDITKEIELIPHVKEVLDNLSENHELYIITARSNYYSNNLKKLTLEFINKNNLPIKEIYFDCFEQGKAYKCKELNIDLFIDDNINNCLEVKKLNIDVILFNNKYDSLKSFDNWIDILKYIKE